jgi:flagellar biosynthetic protein FliP
MTPALRTLWLCLLLTAGAFAQAPAPAPGPEAAPAPEPAPAAPAATPAPASTPVSRPKVGGNGVVPVPGVKIDLTKPRTPAENYSALQVMFLLTAIVLAPTMLMMVTSFTRIIIVLGFLRQALGTPQVPPNQVLLGLALFMTTFIMAPVFREIQEQSIQPYLAEQIDAKTAMVTGMAPLRAFMLRNTRPNDLALFLSIAKENRPVNSAATPTYVLIPSFCLSELKTAFEIGFLIFIPFVVIDLVVASVLMSMGMMMMSPMLVSAPFKILLFVLVDGWVLVVGTLAGSFNPTVMSTAATAVGAG